MTTWESGRESGLLDDIITGRKTIEGRLNRGKFTDCKTDDVVSLRRDYRDEDGVLHDGEPSTATVKIMAIRHYPDFLTMVTQEGYQNAIPAAADAQHAADEYNRFYSAEDQARYGVLAIAIMPVSTN